LRLDGKDLAEERGLIVGAFKTLFDKVARGRFNRFLCLGLECIEIILNYWFEISVPHCPVRMEDVVCCVEVNIVAESWRVLAKLIIHAAHDCLNIRD